MTALNLDKFNRIRSELYTKMHTQGTLGYPRKTIADAMADGMIACKKGASAMHISWLPDLISEGIAGHAGLVIGTPDRDEPMTFREAIDYNEQVQVARVCLNLIPSYLWVPNTLPEGEPFMHTLRKIAEEAMAVGRNCTTMSGFVDTCVDVLVWIADTNANNLRRGHRSFTVSTDGNSITADGGLSYRNMRTLMALAMAEAGIASEPSISVLKQLKHGRVMLSSKMAYATYTKGVYNAEVYDKMVEILANPKLVLNAQGEGTTRTALAKYSNIIGSKFVN